MCRWYGEPRSSITTRSEARAPILPAWAYGVALAAICILSRLPQLLSPNLLLDGDECVAGIMAKHLAEMREFPTFFYGQRFSFSSVEAAAGAVAFTLFGVRAIPLKAMELVLWTVGVVLLFLALARRCTTARSFWILSVFALSPAWAVWSMKARPGYMTAFTASAALVWLITTEPQRAPLLRWVAAGVLTALIYLAQPLWLPGVLPIVAAVLIARRRVPYAIAYASVIAITAVFVRTSAPGGWTIGNADLLGSLRTVAQQIYVNLTGSYYLWWAIDVPGPATSTLSVLWCGILPALAALQLYRLAARRYHAVSHLLFASLCATIGSQWLLIHARDPRYLLPISALIVVLAGIEIVDLVDRRILPARATAAVTLALLVTGSVSLFEFRKFTFLWPNPPHGWSEARRLEQVTTYLAKNHVRHVFSMNGLLEWQLMFYSGETLIARYQNSSDRYPAYVREVDDALERGEPVAVVGYANTSGAPGCDVAGACTGGIETFVPPTAIYTVDRKYFIYVAPTKELLRELHFQLREE